MTDTILEWAKMRSPSTTKLDAALIKAQTEVDAVAKGANHPLYGKVATAESIMAAGKEALNQNDIAVLPLANYHVEESNVSELDAKVPAMSRGRFSRRFMEVVHKSGEWRIIGPFDFPSVVQTGRPADQAWPGADTRSLGYVYRSLLAIPRITEQEKKQMDRDDEILARKIAEENQRTVEEKHKKLLEAEAMDRALKASDAAVKAAKDAPKPVVDTQTGIIITLTPPQSPGATVLPKPPTDAPSRPAEDEVAKRKAETDKRNAETIAVIKTADAAKPAPSSPSLLAPPRTSAVPATAPLIDQDEKRHQKALAGSDTILGMIDEGAARQEAKHPGESVSQAPAAAPAAALPPTAPAPTNSSGATTTLESRRKHMIRRIMVDFKASGKTIDAYRDDLNKEILADVVGTKGVIEASLTDEVLKRLDQAIPVPTPAKV